jgi:glycosyltransferase involved in cell wall biosynthesis
MSAVDVPITYTEYGRKQCINQYPAIKDKLQVIPHGINVKEFFPVDPAKLSELRKFYFGPHADKFIIVNINRNQQRKDIPRTLMVFKEFKKECPNSILYLHMAEKDVGWDLPRVCKHLDLTVGADVIFPRNFNVNSGFPVGIVNDLYNCGDVCISTTCGGGWELSSVESMATKTPCIFPDNTALTEIFADGRGFLCRSGDTPNMHHVFTMDNEIIRPLANISDYVKYLKRLYEKPEIGRQMADKAYQWVHANLLWERDIVPKFDYIFQSLYADLQRPQQAIEAMSAQATWQKGESI